VAISPHNIHHSMNFDFVNYDFNLFHFFSLFFCYMFFFKLNRKKTCNLDIHFSLDNDIFVLAKEKKLSFCDKCITFYEIFLQII
jgi:hypothetical protein